MPTQRLTSGWRAGLHVARRFLSWRVVAGIVLVASGSYWTSALATVAGSPPSLFPPNAAGGGNEPTVAIFGSENSRVWQWATADGKKPLWISAQTTLSIQSCSSPVDVDVQIAASAPSTPVTAPKARMRIIAVITNGSYDPFNHGNSDGISHVSVETAVAQPGRATRTWKAVHAQIGQPSRQESLIVRTPTFTWNPTDIVDLAFQAHWLHYRSYGTCYASVPTLVAVSPPLLRGYAPLIRTSTLLVRGSGSVDAAQSIPSPSSGLAGWNCSWATSLTLPPNACSPLVVFEEPNAEGRVARRDTLAGILIGLGLALLVSLLPPPEWQRRHKADAKSDTQQPMGASRK